MARTVTEIFEAIKANYVTERATASLVYDNPLLWSKVNLKCLIFFVVALAMYLQELIFEKQVAETAEDLANLRPPSVNWYAMKCKAYQHGFPLIGESDVFDNTGYTDTQIEASKVIKYAAVQRQVGDNGFVLFLRFKLCGENGSELAQLSDEVLAGFAEYKKRFEAAGDNIQVISRPADKLKMVWRVFYNPAILNESGARLDGTASQPVKDAILSFLKSGLPFNGEYSLTKHIDAVQAVQGVLIPNVLAASASWEGLPYLNIAEYYQPFGGWLRFDNLGTDLTIEYLPK